MSYALYTARAQAVQRALEEAPLEFAREGFDFHRILPSPVTVGPSGDRVGVSRRGGLGEVEETAAEHIRNALTVFDPLVRACADSRAFGPPEVLEDMRAVRQRLARALEALGDPLRESRP